MSTRKLYRWILVSMTVLAGALIVFVVQAGPNDSPLFAPAGTAFTYQGFLNDSGSPANGSYDFDFMLYDDAVSGSQVGSTINLQDVTVTDGAFTVTLDFGSVFDGAALWLEIRVRPGTSTGGYQQLLPRQPLTPVPYASYAIAAPWSGLTGVPGGFADNVDNDTTYSAGDGLDLTSNQFSVVYLGSGSSTSASRSDHDHIGSSWAGSSGGSILSISNSNILGTSVFASSSEFGGIGLSGTGGGKGVFGGTGSGYGVYGEASHASNQNYGVYGVTASSGGYGGMFVNYGGGALLAADNDTDHSNISFRVSNVGNVFADGSFTGGGADYAELLPAQQVVEPGHVVCMQADGTVSSCSSPFDVTVVGVVSKDPGFIAGGGGSEEDWEGKAPIAMMGVVPVRASAENGSIQIGDLLVSSSTAGHAMAAGHAPLIGTVIGKALESLEKGTGVIQMLVMLQ